MPILFGGVVLVLEVICIVHAVRTNRVQPWIYILVFLGPVGVIAYCIVELGPDLMGARGVRALQRGIVKVADPTRDFREAQRANEIVGSVEAKASLAEEHVKRGDFGEAIALYESTLTGMHVDDPMLLYGLARAKLAAGDGAGAQAALDDLKEANPDYSSPDAHLVYALALEAQDKVNEARQEYDALCQYFPGEEARCRYALLLTRTGDKSRSRQLFEEIVKRSERAAGHYRRAQKEWIQIARRELAGGTA